MYFNFPEFPLNFAINYNFKINFNYLQKIKIKYKDCNLTQSELNRIKNYNKDNKNKLERLYTKINTDIIEKNTEIKNIISMKLIRLTDRQKNVRFNNPVSFFITF